MNNFPKISHLTSIKEYYLSNNELKTASLLFRQILILNLSPESLIIIYNIGYFIAGSFFIIWISSSSISSSKDVDSNYLIYSNNSKSLAAVYV